LQRGSGKFTGNQFLIAKSDLEITYNPSRLFLNLPTHPLTHPQQAITCAHTTFYEICKYFNKKLTVLITNYVVITLINCPTLNGMPTIS
jgi:hypothetical protein